MIINFDNNRSGITDTARKIIDNLFSGINTTFIVQTIKLSGYCDNIGRDRYNDSLSAARTTSIRKYLAAYWVNPVKIDFEHGFGKKFPLNDNSTDAYRAANRRVELIVQKKYFVISETVPEPSVVAAKKDSTLYKKILDTATVTGTNIILQHIIFYGGSHLPMPEAFPVMNQLAEAMKANMKLKIEIDGYVCCEQDNQDGMDNGTGRKDLSVARAKYIYDFLVTGGIHKSRISYAGFGASFKLYPREKSSTEQMLNRRVEIKIVTK